MARETKEPLAHLERLLAAFPSGPVCYQPSRTSYAEMDDEARAAAALAPDRVVAKLFSTGPRTPAFLSRFPDAHILYMVRDPVEVIPSTFSLVTGVLDNAFGYWKLPDDVRARYNERLYVALVDLFARFHKDYTSGRIDRSRVMVVSYDRMMQDFDGLMGEMSVFFDMKPTAEPMQAIQKTAVEQRAYKSKHKYNLEKYGLSADRIRKDCAFVYETWLNDPQSAAPPPADPAPAPSAPVAAT